MQRMTSMHRPPQAKNLDETSILADQVTNLQVE